MHDLFRILLAVHIFAGAIALVVAPGAMVTVKGGRWHARWGWTYLWATVAIAVTGAVMSLIHPNLFLMMIAVFSFYLVFSGYRVLHRKKPGQRATWFDQAVTLAMMVAGLGLVAYGVYRLQTSSFGAVPIVFGAIALLLAAREWIGFRRQPAEPRWWWFSHMTNMLAAYITTVSAFSVVNMMFLPPIVRWLWPTVVGTTGILLWTRYYRRKFAQQGTRTAAVANTESANELTG